MAEFSNTEPKTAPQTDAAVLLPALSKLGVPVGIFGAAFFVIAVVITLLFSPDRFPVRAGDKTVRLYDLESEERALKSRKAELLETRQKILGSSEATILRQVEKLRADITPVGTVLLGIETVRASFKAAGNDPISIPQVNFDGTHLTIGGEVRDSSGRSMQVLASFVDELRALGAVTSVSEPEYKTNTLPDGTTVSPFTITLTLHS
jgi:hypothetical protein